LENVRKGIPQPGGVRATVEDVLHSLLLLFTKLTFRRPQNAPFSNIFPSQNFLMVHQPHEELDFHPTLVRPELPPRFFWHTGLQPQENIL